MAISRVGASQAIAGTVTGTTGQPLTVAAGTINNLIVVGAFHGTNQTNPITISDTQGNTWNVCNPDFTDTGLTRMASWYALAKNTASTTVTVKTTDTGGIFFAMTLEEFTANHTTAPLDQVNHSAIGATGTNPTGVSITLGANDCLVWSLYVDTSTTPFVGAIDGTTATKGSDDGVGDITEFRVLTGRSGVSVNAAFTGSGTYENFIASFKPPASGDTQEWRGTYPPARRTGTINVTY